MAGPFTVGESCRLELSDGAARRSGAFPVAGAPRVVRPGEQSQGGVAFEDVDWDAIQGSSQLSGPRFRVDLFVGDG